ncbi:hypothetical protein C8R44DRAFT_739360 [Mycena epipterygia]|nr:hypothetical protein C8R44DRAFT_739360 [Mycena epipterygia]
MAPPTWADDAQTAWLRGWMGDFMRRQGEGKLHLFWSGMQEAWFHRWPEERPLKLPIPSDADARALTDTELLLLGAAIRARKNQLENWFRNQRKKIGNASTATSQTRSATALFKNIFKLNAPKRRRAHKPIEQFQICNTALIDTALDEAGYNELKLENMGEMDWTNEAAGTEEARNKSLKSMRMRMRTRVVTALWEEADVDEVKAVEAEVEAEKLELREAELKAEADLDPSVPDARTVWELQDGIDALEPVFAEVHKATHHAAGWVGMSIVGGPNPRLKGEFSYKVICFGETPAGNDFEESCVDFDKNVTEPFEEYLRAVFTAQEQRARALPSRPEPESSARGASRGGEGDEDEALLPVAPLPQKKRKRAPKPKKKAVILPGPAIVPVAPIAPASSTPSSTPSSTSTSTPSLPSILSSTPSDVGVRNSFAASVSPFRTPTHALSGEEAGTLDAFSMDPLVGFDFDAMMLDPHFGSSPLRSSSPPLLSCPSSPSPDSAFTLRPIPRPSYRGFMYAAPAAVATENVGGYNFPLQSLPGSQVVAHLLSPAPATVPPALRTPSTGTFASRTARAMYGIINEPPPAVAATPNIAPVVAPTTLPIIFPTTANIAPTPPVIAPAAAIPVVTATIPVASVANDEVDEFPRSRPPTKVPTAKQGVAEDAGKGAKKGPGGRKTAAKKTAQPKAGTVAAEKQQAAVATAQKVVGVEEKVKRARGRPRKIATEAVVPMGDVVGVEDAAPPVGIAGPADLLSAP